MTPSQHNCPKCQKPLAPDAPMGLCPECLVKAGFPTDTEAGTAESSERRPAFVPPPLEVVGRLFPQLEILGLLGQGGMGAVYKARQPALDRLVALKILPPRNTGDPGFAERFTREARALARLNHPNIVGVHEFGQAGALHYFVMEYVEGLSLRQLEQAGKLSPREALKIIPQICDALQFAHDEGVVHRDIKPENVMLDKKGRVKITDFGLAKILGHGPKNMRLTGAKDVMGTPHYMAPEQIEHPQEVDHRADIYSLGVVFYEVLTGELPLGKFQPPSKKVQVDVRLDEIVLHALEKEPERRYQQASQVKSDVETIALRPDPGTGQKDVPDATRRRASTESSPAVPAFTSKSDPFWKWFAVAGLLLLAVLIILNTVLRQSAAPKSEGLTRDTNQLASSEFPSADTLVPDADDYTQSQVIELLPNGLTHFRTTFYGRNETAAPWHTYQFINSDFVNVTNITDARYRPIRCETTHEGGIFHFSLTLNEPVPPGGRLLVTTEGTTTGQIKPTGAPGVFEYDMRHWPSSDRRTRRVELHRLPPGARLLDKEPGDLHERTRDGRVELFIDRLIPPGDSLEIIYHYRLDAPAVGATNSKP